MVEVGNGRGLGALPLSYTGSVCCVVCVCVCVCVIVCLDFLDVPGFEPGSLVFGFGGLSALKCAAKLPDELCAHCRASR